MLHKNSYLHTILLILLLSLSIIPALAQSENATAGNNVNVRAAPAPAESKIGDIAINTRVVVEGRNVVGDWILVRTADNSIRGWVVAPFFAFDEGLFLMQLPVSEERFAGAAPPPPPESSSNNEAPPLIVNTGGQSGTGTTIDTLNVRVVPSTNEPSITQISGGVNVIIEARNRIGDWIIIRTLDNTIRGWVASRFVRFGEGVTLTGLPVSDERIGSVPPPTNDQQPPPPSSDGQIIGNNLNVRTGPGTNNSPLTQLQIQTRVIVEASNADHGWVLIRTVDNGVRGWVSSRFVRLDNRGSVNTLPVSNEIIGQSQSDQPEEVTEAVPNIQLPTGDLQNMLARLQNTPHLHNIVNGTVVNIFNNGRNMGNRPNVFMKVGDSRLATQPLLKGFGQGSYSLGSYGYLQDTVNFFAGPPAGNSANSFVRDSISAQSGFTSGAVFDGLWVNPAECTEAPLYCEYDKLRPSVALVMFGPIDMQIRSAFEFQAHIYRMTGDLVDRGVIPVLTTFANYNDYRLADAIMFNTIILNAARDYNVPVINLWGALQPLPDNGIKVSDPVHMTHSDSFYSLNGQENTYGIDRANLLILQAFDELRKNILLR